MAVITEVAEDRVVGTSSRSTSFAARLSTTANSLNAIRLVLASTVIVLHSWVIEPYGPTPTHGGFSYAGWAVDGFFVLSGYLVTGSRLKGDLWAYLRRRILRIYPGFLVCLLSVVLLFAPITYVAVHHTLAGYLTTPTTPVRYLLTNLGLKMHAQSVAGTPGGIREWTGTLWTLYFEFLCYLLVALLACLRSFRTRPQLTVGLFALATALSLLNPHVNHHTVPANLGRLVPFFLAGTVTYLYRDRIPCVWPGAVASAAVLVVIPFAGPRYVVLCALPLTYLLLYLGAVVPITWGRRTDISYGMYMYGFPVEESIRFLHLGSQFLYVVFAMVATVPIAFASWFLVERPAMRWRRTGSGKLLRSA